MDPRTWREVMNAKQFCDFLAQMMPTREELEEWELDEAEIEDVQQSFLGEPRSGNVSERATELERLISAYDCSKVEVGLVRFLDAPRKVELGTRVAYFEADHIVVVPSGEVVLCDWRLPKEVWLSCARDSESFLDGLSVFLRQIRDRERWSGRESLVAQRCATAAGGTEYLPFFQALCPVFRADE